jgi:DNA helicase-2/ATP-dependent DNA helicase PcrA
VDDQKRMWKRIAREMQLDPKEFDPKVLAWQISQWKNRLLDPKQVSPGDERQVVFQHAYKRYQELCTEECVFDFDDLLMRTVKLFESDPEVLAKYQERFPYILIDEYQDTNAAQYALIRQLGAHGNVCATGDPDQAIYGWRGADLENILRFEKDFPGCHTVLLEQNYRSTKTVLRAAQAVVEHNTLRKDKTIFTNNPQGSRIKLVTVDDQDDEGMAIAAAAERMHKAGRRLDDIAVFYRTNAQSRTLEEWLIRRGVPYRIIGGTRFYDRKEVKDLLAYLKLMVNPRDLMALTRIVNVPRRGIGDRTWEMLRDLAYDEGVSVHEVLMVEELLERVAVGRSATPLRSFAGLMARLQAMDLTKAGECVRQVLQLTDIEEYVLETDEEQGPDRVANLREVLTAAQQYDAAEQGGLEGFLDHICLLTSEDESGASDDQLVLMTLHASKGLEFPVVFITGLEQGVMPLVRQGRPCDYEEERRLMYVGITRAKEELYLCNCVVRTQFGKTTRNPPSMFLAEVPDACIEHADRAKRPLTYAEAAAEGPVYPANSLAHMLSDGTYDDTISGPRTMGDAIDQGLLMSGAALKSALRGKTVAAGSSAQRKQNQDRDDEPIALPGDPFAAKDRVVHTSFGEGTVERLEGPPADRRIIITFDKAGVKELLVSFAAQRLSKIG